MCAEEFSSQLFVIIAFLAICLHKQQGKNDAEAPTLPLNGASCHLAFILVVWTAVAGWHRPFSESPLLQPMVRFKWLKSQAVKAIIIPVFIILENILIPHA